MPSFSVCVDNRDVRNLSKTDVEAILNSRAENQDMSFDILRPRTRADRELLNPNAELPEILPENIFGYCHLCPKCQTYSKIANFIRHMRFGKHNLVQNGHLGFLTMISICSAKTLSTVITFDIPFKVLNATRQTDSLGSRIPANFMCANFLRFDPLFKAVWPIFKASCQEAFSVRAYTCSCSSKGSAFKTPCTL